MNFCISHGGFWLQGISRYKTNWTEGPDQKTRERKHNKRIQGTRASCAWRVEGDVKRDCTRTRQHPMVGRAEKSEKVLTPRRQYSMGTACQVFLSNAKAAVHRGGGGETGWGWWHCHLRAGHFPVLAVSIQRSGMKKQRRSFAFKSSPGLAKCLASCFFLENSPEHVHESD